MYVDIYAYKKMHRKHLLVCILFYISINTLASLINELFINDVSSPLIISSFY